MVRLPEKVITCPKFAWPKTAIGALGSSVLVKLKASARNCIVIFSLTLNSRWMLKSMSQEPGANKVFRQITPCVSRLCHEGGRIEPLIDRLVCNRRRGHHIGTVGACRAV